MLLEDDLPMSPAHGRKGFFLHFTWLRDEAGLLKALPHMERVLHKFNAKPHLGKLFVLSGRRFEELYGDDLLTLRALLKKLDPKGKFRNNFMDKYIFNEDQATVRRQLAKL